MHHRYVKNREAVSLTSGATPVGVLFFANIYKIKLYALLIYIFSAFSLEMQLLLCYNVIEIIIQFKEIIL